MVFSKVCVILVALVFPWDPFGLPRAVVRGRGYKGAFVKLIIYGNGNMARVLYSFARRQIPVGGFTVDPWCIQNNESSFCGLPLIPFDRVQDRFLPDEYQMLSAIGFLAMNDLREKKYLEAKAKGYSFSRYVHESVLIHDEVEIEENCILLDHVSVHPGTKIRRGTFVSSNVNIGHTCTIGANNFINSGVAIAGGCSIGDGCFFGVNSCVGHGVHMGARNFVAANTLLNKDTQDDEVYLSEPGQLFRLKSKAFLKFAGLS